MTDLFGNETTIKALALWQPRASLVARGFKRHDCRTWTTDYRGMVAIVAGKKVDVGGAPEDLCLSAFGQHWADDLPRGAVVAIAKLATIVPAEVAAARTTRADLRSGNFTPGAFAWDFRQVRPLAEPIPVAGRQGLFDWPAPTNLEALLKPTRDHRDECFRAGWL